MALCGGVHRLQACTYDELISVPTQEEREVATCAQQIPGHDLSARMTDPLGGSRMSDR